MGRLALTGMAAPVERGRGAWTRVSISGIEDLADAVYGAGLAATQMSRAPLHGSLAFAERDSVLYSSGSIDGRVALRGPLSESRVTLGIGLRIAPGSRHWLRDVETGDFGVFMPGDEHDAFYAPGTVYATVTLSIEALEPAGERAGLVVDRRTLGGSGIYPQRLAASTLIDLAMAFDRVHAGRPSVCMPGGRRASPMPLGFRSNSSPLSSSRSDGRPGRASAAPIREGRRASSPGPATMRRTTSTRRSRSRLC